MLMVHLRGVRRQLQAIPPLRGPFDRGQVVAAASVPGLLSCANQMIRMIQPTSGMSPTSCSQPLRLVSCRRRAPTASEGTSVASENTAEIIWLTKPSTRATMKLKSTHHQNSERVARPANSAYFLKHV